MKKALAILSVLALTACGNGASKEATTDSTAAQVDSLALTGKDSTAAIQDSAAAPVKAEEPVK